MYGDVEPRAVLIDNHSPLLISGRPEAHDNAVMQIHLPQLRDTVVRASRHHIIPYNFLSRFFNAVMRRSRTHLIELQNFAGGLLQLVRNARSAYRRGNIIIAEEVLNHAEAFVNRMREGRVSITTPAAGFTLVERLVAIPAIHVLFSWMPGNIFIGPEPSRRLDDPENQFEDDVSNIIGPEAHRRLRDLYHLMRD